LQLCEDLLDRFIEHVLAHAEIRIKDKRPFIYRRSRLKRDVTCIIIALYLVVCARSFLTAAAQLAIQKCGRLFPDHTAGYSRAVQPAAALLAHLPAFPGNHP
jgi:hypothetical protein